MIQSMNMAYLNHIFLFKDIDFSLNVLLLLITLCTYIICIHGRSKTSSYELPAWGQEDAVVGFARFRYLPIPDIDKCEHKIPGMYSCQTVVLESAIT